MLRLGLSLTTLALLSACKTTGSSSTAKSTGITQSSAQPPIFDIMEWEKHPGGPKQDPYFLQTEVYSFDIETPTAIIADAKTVARSHLINAPA